MMVGYSTGRRTWSTTVSRAISLISRPPLALSPPLARPLVSLPRLALSICARHSTCCCTTPSHQPLHSPTPQTAAQYLHTSLYTGWRHRRERHPWVPDLPVFVRTNCTFHFCITLHDLHFPPARHTKITTTHLHKAPSSLTIYPWQLKVSSNHGAPPRKSASALKRLGTKTPRH